MSPSDLVCIPYNSDLTLAGILYACRSLALGQVRASNLHLNPLRSLSAEIAADLSLRRYLAQEKVSFNAREAEPFTHPERSEIFLGRRPCHVLNTTIAHKQYLRRIEANPAELLTAPACASEAALTSDKWEYQDLLIFTFSLGVPKPPMSVPGNAQTDINPDYFIYILPEAWRNARLDGPIPGLSMQNASDEEITIELGGRATNRSYVAREIRLPPRQPVVVAEDFTNLVYLSAQRALTATISAYHPNLKRTLHISHDRWGNLWVEGVKIILAGYIEVGEFRRFAHRWHASDQLWGSVHSSSQNLSLNVQDLQPLPQLIAWLRAIQNTR